MTGWTSVDVRGLGELAECTLGSVGDEGTRLLAGPPASAGAETLGDHLARLGPLPLEASPADLRAVLRESGLQGRGGGGFPVARKLETALLAPGEPIVVVNASESEPASRKDRVLCTHRPQLILDGAVAMAKMVGAREIAVHLHDSSAGARIAIGRALAERRETATDECSWHLSIGPDRYVAGEASAIASLLDGGEARPYFTGRPMAEAGPSGRPTLVHNAETMAHVGLLLRTGAPWWRSGGTASSPGTQLVTLGGGCSRPGLVMELTGSASIGEVLTAAGEVSPPAAVLVGGFAGTWIEGDVAWQTPFERTALKCVDASPGCGLLGVLPHGACGLVENARIVRYLAEENAGQCGPCVTGLPAMADLLDGLAVGSLRRSGLRRVRELCGTVSRGGACGHPDGVVHLVRSALDTFEDDVVRHLAGRPCRASFHPPVFAVPDGQVSIWESS